MPSAQNISYAKVAYFGVACPGYLQNDCFNFFHFKILCHT